MLVDSKRTLLVSGALLFLIGLSSGAAISVVTNPRLGLSAHLAGVQNALFLLVVGALWENVNLVRLLRALLLWTGIGSMYGFWLALQLGAVWGTSTSTPIAGAGFAGLAWQETLVSLLLRASSVAAMVAATLLLAGFVARVKPAI